MQAVAGQDMQAVAGQGMQAVAGQGMQAVVGQCVGKDGVLGQARVREVQGWHHYLVVPVVPGVLRCGVVVPGGTWCVALWCIVLCCDLVWYVAGG